ncbi:unnamed protein product [Nippostrongylus brasiliensis]|uniref:Secreted protein n=1 Tax=Nippostrongylus brasiliensis TaxID=27835 RepID=A0A0N4XW38_NIPBR|nr:unnamed protein product [Nippostrongylus brasiliensis]
MIWTNTLDTATVTAIIISMSSSSTPSSPSLIRLPVLFLCLQTAITSAQLLEIFGLSTGDAGTVDRQPFHDLASQSVGLINYLQTVQRNPNNQLAKKCVRLRGA